MRLGSGQLSTPEQGVPKGIVGLQEEHGIVLVLGQTEQLLPQPPGGLELCTHHIKGLQAPQDPEELWSLPYVLTELLGAGIGVLDVRSRIALDGDQRLAQEEL